MPNMTRNELRATVGRMGGKIVSFTWLRLTTKRHHICPTCNADTASHAGQWVCNDHGVVRSMTEKRAEQGDMVTMQCRLPMGLATKNFTAVGGNQFNAATPADAAAMREPNELLRVTKMSETGTGDMRGTPRNVPIRTVERFKSGGVTYDIVD